MTATVDTPTQRYIELEKKRALPRTLMGGTTAMRAAGKTFLPQHPAETDEAYRVRLEGTTLYNGFQKAVAEQVGKLFADPITVGADVPAQAVALLPDIDGQGRQLTPFVMDLTADAFVDGISYVLVDFPPLTAASESSPATLADQQLIGARPYWVHIKAQQLIGWRSENIGGAQVLTEARIMESTYEQDGEWGETLVERIRVLRIGSYQLYRKEKVGAQAGQYLFEKEGLTTWDFIPLVPIYTNRCGFFEGEPPLTMLADLNLEHWISSSEQRKALTFCRFAMLALIGVDAKSAVTIGPDKTIKLPMGADAKYIEPSGAAIEAGRKDLEAIEARMQHAGMSLRIENSGKVTATAAAIDSQESNAGLAAVADGIGDSVELALDYTARMLGLAPGSGGTVALVTDFGTEAAAGSVQELTTIVTVGKISHQTYLNELKRRGVLSEEVDVLDEIERTGTDAQT